MACDLKTRVQKGLWPYKDIVVRFVDAAFTAGLESDAQLCV